MIMKNKKDLSIFYIIGLLSVIFLGAFIAGIIIIQKNCFPQPYIPPKIYAPEFSTKYSSHEHVNRIDELLKDTQKDKLTENTLTYEIYIIHGFDDVPEYFLIEYNTIVRHNIQGVLTDVPTDCHLLGFIENDAYYVFETQNKQYSSKWKEENVLNKKLYWGSDYCAYLEDNGNIYSWHQHDSSEKFIVKDDLKSSLADCRFNRPKTLLKDCYL